MKMWSFYKYEIFKIFFQKLFVIYFEAFDFKSHRVIAIF
jgi:hypothetical protein